MNVWENVYSLFTKYKSICGVCVWLVKLLLTFSVAIDNAWKSIVQCHSHKKCPISVVIFVYLSLSGSMLKCLSVIVDLLFLFAFLRILFFNVFWSYC